MSSTVPGSKLKISVACIHRPVCGLDLKESRPLDAEIEVVTGVFQIAFSQIHLAAARDAEVVDCPVEA